jgi:DNA helicase II / ATP-dependent DNA helicase PcrA
VTAPPSPTAHVPGPAVLGRGVVVAPGAPAPDGFADARRVTVDDEVAAVPEHVAALLHQHWVRRIPVVVELAADNDALRAPEVLAEPPYRLSPDTLLHRERLHFLLWANNYDARRGAPIWWHGVLATRRGAAPSEVADVALPSGEHVWVDGGPRGPLELPTIHRESVALSRLTPLGTAAPRDALAPDQLDAVTHGQGPARVVAPAGSGKTRVLTARLRHLLVDRGYEPELVTAVAYNTRAAEEMRSRLTDLPPGADVRTIHSLAYAICRAERSREVIGEREVRSILDRLVRTARIPNTDPFQPYLEALAEVRLALRDPEAVEAERDDVPGFAEAFDAYRAELDRRGVIDFDDQIYRAIELLLTRPDLRRDVQRSCTHLLVDEFQDLTPAFLLLLRLAAGPSLQVFGVGDDDQVIYGYAGATPSYLIDFDRLFPGAGHHALEVNYRCPPAVVDAAVHLLSHNRRRVAKTIRAAADDPDPRVDAAAGAGA